MEGSGIIDAIGVDVDQSRLGQAVVVGTQYGCYAEKVVVPQEQALTAIIQYNNAENAAFLVNYMTAWVALVEVARVQPGETVLVSAAAGGVGTAGIQIAAALGCLTYGLAGSDEKCELVKSLGATDAFNYSLDSWTADIREKSKGVDALLEVVGGEIYRECFKLLNIFGRLVVVGYSSLNPKIWNPISWWRTWRDIPRVDLMETAIKSGGIMATHLGYLLRDKEKMLDVYERMKNFLIANKIKPLISAEFPLAEAGQAQQFIQERKNKGKVLLKIQD
jgi:NADPH:quinone reductase-like Zn-dependent oxidoreductase